MIAGTVNFCPICEGRLNYAFNATVLRRHNVKYFYCPECGLTTTEDPYWLSEAYCSAVSMADTGLVQRNLRNSESLSVLLYFGFNRLGSYLDIGGGYGMLVRLMRDIGFDFYWDDKHCRNELARGFEYDYSTMPFCALTAFEVMEHLPNPVVWLKKAIQEYRSETFIFTTETYDGSSSPDINWWYYSFATGQHVSFYQSRTLQALGERVGLRYQKLAGLHVLTAIPARNTRALELLPYQLISPAAKYVRKRMSSKTFQDHLALLSRSFGSPD